MKKRVQIQNIKPSQILTNKQTSRLKGGDGEGTTDGGNTAEEIIIEDTQIV